MDKIVTLVEGFHLLLDTIIISVGKNKAKVGSKR